MRFALFPQQSFSFTLEVMLQQLPLLFEVLHINWSTYLFWQKQNRLAFSSLFPNGYHFTFSTKVEISGLAEHTVCIGTPFYGVYRNSKMLPSKYILWTHYYEWTFCTSKKQTLEALILHQLGINCQLLLCHNPMIKCAFYSYLYQLENCAVQRSRKKILAVTVYFLIAKLIKGLQVFQNVCS